MLNMTYLNKASLIGNKKKNVKFVNEMLKSFVHSKLCFYLLLKSLIASDIFFVQSLRVKNYIEKNALK